MDFGSVLLGILAFIVLLSIIIIIHELGHLMTAKKFGVVNPTEVISLNAENCPKTLQHILVDKRTLGA